MTWDEYDTQLSVLEQAMQDALGINEFNDLQDQHAGLFLAFRREYPPEDMYELALSRSSS